MNEAASSLFASVWLTYLLRSVVAYAILWLICQFIRDPHLRFQLCGVFLGGMVMAWFGLLVRPALPVSSISSSAANTTVPGQPWVWALHLALTPRLAIVLSRVWWGYVAILALLLLRFCASFWKLRIVLYASQPPSEALATLFESVRSGTRGSRCELWLVPDLRSPAATGWWRPKVLLPHDFLPRLETQQLADVLRHELMHVRRRDYLWDRLATLGCYLLFFHPAAWLVRRRLRWERELVCDEGVVEGSDIRRLEYATCLTTLASWWRLPDEKPAGPIDFLSSPSLLTARIRALVSPRRSQNSARKKAALGILASAALAVTVRVVPEVAVTSAWSQPVPREAARIQEPPAQPQPILKTQRSGMPRRRKPIVSVATAPDQYSRLTTLTESLSSHSRSTPATEIPSSSPILPTPHEVQSHRSSGRQHMHWGLIRKVGTWTVHTIKFGVMRLGSISESKRQSQSSGELPQSAPDNSTDPR
jgi:beta-lactamase regulating signal transducer with metallopeptidase domain